MPGIKSVSFTDPATVDLERIRRQQALAMQLQKQSEEPLASGQMAGGYFVPTSPLSHLAKALKGAQARRSMTESDEELKAMIARQEGDFNTDRSALVRALRGSPTDAGVDDPTAGYAPPSQAVAPNPRAMEEMQFRSPSFKQFQLQDMMQRAQMEPMRAAIAGLGQSSQGAPGPVSGGTQGGFQPVNPALLNLATMPGGAGPAKLISDREIATQRSGMDWAKLQQADRHWSGLSAAQQAELRFKGINSAIDLARAMDEGIINQGQTPGASQAPQGDVSFRFQSPGGGPIVEGSANEQSALNIGRNILGMKEPSASAPDPVAGLSPKQQRALEQKRKEQEIEAGGAYTQAAAKGSFERDNAQYDAATTAVENITKLDTILNHLKTSSAITGIGSELLKDVDRLKVFVTNNAAAGKRVSDTELLDAFLGSDVFPMIKALGIGARGLDTPSEREFLRQVMSGTTPMNKETLVRLTQFRRDIAERAMKKFNDRVDKGEMDRFFAGSGIGKTRIESVPSKQDGFPKTPAPQDIVDELRRRGVVK